MGNFFVLSISIEFKYLLHTIYSELTQQYLGLTDFRLNNVSGTAVYACLCLSHYTVVSPLCLVSSRVKECTVILHLDSNHRAEEDTPIPL